jgi:hypothetical protein
VLYTLPPAPVQVRMQVASAAPMAEVLFMWDFWNYFKPLDLILIASGAVVGIPLLILYLMARSRKAKKKGKAKNKE